MPNLPDNPQQGHADQPDMTPRDWFACHALPMVWDLNKDVARVHGSAAGFAKSVARDVYEIADAMLAQRSS